MLVLKFKEKMMEEWKRTPFNATKTGSSTDIFIDQVHKFQNSYFKEYLWKAPTVLQKALF